MKILLVAINAKYIHSNLAAYSLRAYAAPFREQVELLEYTINHRTDFILQEIYKSRPDVVCFSCYIWNISVVEALVEALGTLMPDLPLWLGGPEVSWEAGAFLMDHPKVRGIMAGEGEATFLQLCEHYVRGTVRLTEIPGIVLKDETGQVVATPGRELLPMDELPFCYEELKHQPEAFSHRILYYETSRGCPYRCSYCLSSVEKGLRFRSLPLVFQELAFFLKHKVLQVKFVDRTFNCNREHAMAVWRYLKDHDNGVTNFHFEIAADLLTEEDIALIGQMRPGLIQLEIGVQSTNARTLGEIRRSTDLLRLAKSVLALKETGAVHQHLDLIAGLPYEDYQSFQCSFDRIFRLHPQKLQLGFLKVLKGTYMYENREAYGILYWQQPPYEVLGTRWMSYEELTWLHRVEEMLEVYYNSGQFEMTMKILEQAFDSPFLMFWKLGDYYERQGLFQRKHTRMGRSEILLAFVKEEDAAHLELYRETLTFDLYYRENMKSRPPWAMEPGLFKEAARKLGRERQSCHLEPFYHDFTMLLENAQPGYPKRKQEWEFYCFSYEKRDPLTGQAKVERISWKEP